MCDVCVLLVVGCGLFVGLLVGWLAGWMAGWLVGLCCAACVVVRVVGWVVSWLVGVDNMVVAVVVVGGGGGGGGSVRVHVGGVVGVVGVGCLLMIMLCCGRCCWLVVVIDAVLVGCVAVDVAC